MLDDASVLEHDDEIRVADRREPVGDDEARPVGPQRGPGENHHADTCTEATAMAIVSTERTKAIRRFLVMNCLVSCVRRV